MSVFETAGIDADHDAGNRRTEEQMLERWKKQIIYHTDFGFCKRRRTYQCHEQLCASSVSNYTSAISAQNTYIGMHLLQMFGLRIEHRQYYQYAAKEIHQLLRF